LSHISTTVLRLSSFGHHTLKVEADSKALPNPIEQDRARDGVISTLASNCSQQIIIALEYRKRSGRTISERHTVNLTSGKAEPLDRKPEEDSRDTRGLDFGTTFNLGMTQRQKESKEDVVLPHFSARRIFSGSAVSERSGDIEYTLEAEDDFDDEEDVDEDLLI
jgi:elongator complex protein 5